MSLKVRRDDFLDKKFDDLIKFPKKEEKVVAKDDALEKAMAAYDKKLEKETKK